MKFPDFLPVFGDTAYRGACPSEAMEQVTFFNRLRSQYPETWGRIALHPRNEGKRTPGQVYREKSEGMAEGAPDIVIPPGFLCELKRRDHTKSRWQPGQLEYLEAAQEAGAFVCVALGADAAMEAFHDWLAAQTQ